MRINTLQYLCCPGLHQGKTCKGELRLLGKSPAKEVQNGTLECLSCGLNFPILEGVAVLVPDVRGYLLHHVKGISKFVSDEAIPEEIREEYQELRDELEEEHIEEDLESDRVNALYLMNHYLRFSGSKTEWWKTVSASESPAITDLIQRYWDQGPFSVVSKWVPEGSSVIELGCGVGGLARRLKSGSYLGVDSSFFSIMVARHLNLRAHFKGALGFPGDLFLGPLSNTLPVDVMELDRIDFVVGEIDSLPVKDGAFEVSISLNAIDMLDEPKDLPEAQARVIQSGGIGIQSGPYIWHERIARGLRGRAPKVVQDSAAVVEWLYQKSGFSIESKEAHIPWLFFKHLRQIELYSVHAFVARKER
jgi:SAM-dependent methyltransferase/uncharacterized protein YbaR (Trm112 family)